MSALDDDAAVTSTAARTALPEPAPAAAPRTAESAGSLAVTVEVLGLRVAGDVLQWTTSVGVLPGLGHPDDLARELAGVQGGAAPGVVLHSTSWRHTGAELIVTYALFPDLRPGPARPLSVHLVTGPGPLEPSPAEVSTGHVAAHAVRHLADLAADRDPHIVASARERPHAWQVLTAHARAVHVHPAAPAPAATPVEPTGQDVVTVPSAANTAGHGRTAGGPGRGSPGGPVVLTVRDALFGSRAPVGLAELVEACTARDGHAPFEEHTLLSLDGARQVPHARVELTDTGRLVGCAVLSEGVDGWMVEAAVHPARRRSGLGARLLEATRGHIASHGGGTVRWWVHGSGPGQQALADRVQARVDRRLLVLERALTEPPAARCQDGILLRRLDRADQSDRDDWLALSNAAFAGHPDNGNWTRADLDWRLDATWTDARRFPVAVDAFGLVAGVWTKVEPGSSTGELYVVAVHPRAHGRQLGRLVVAAALRDLHAAGCERAVLYVDATNTSALALYDWAGFTTGVEHRCLAADVTGTHQGDSPGGCGTAGGHDATRASHHPPPGGPG